MMDLFLALPLLPLLLVMLLFRELLWATFGSETGTFIPIVVVTASPRGCRQPEWCGRCWP